MVAKVLLLLMIVCMTHSASDKDEELPPQLPLYMGRSYNLLEGNPLTDTVDPGFRHDIFGWTFNKKITTEDGKYLIPDGVDHRKVSSCSFDTSTSTYRGTTQYQNDLNTKADAKGGYKGLLFKASFSSSFSYQNMQNNTMESNKSITHATAEC